MIEMEVAPCSMLSVECEPVSSNERRRNVYLARSWRYSERARDLIVASLMTKLFAVRTGEDVFFLVIASDSKLVTALDLPCDAA